MANGLVLVAGGFDGSTGAVSEAELWDPSTGLWSPTGANVVARGYHTATELRNGTVLVVGGTAVDGACTTNASAEVYDVSTGTWTAVADVPYPVGIGHIALPLFNGKVLVAGGGNGCGTATASAAIFDPFTGTWTLANPLNAARFNHAGATTNFTDFRLLVADGIGDGGQLLDTAETFSPLTGTWAPTAPLPMPIATACGQSSGSILLNGVLAGGVTGTCPTGTPSAAVLRWDSNAVTDFWQNVTTMSTPRVGHTLSAWLAGAVVIGGTGPDGSALSSSDILGPTRMSSCKDGCRVECRPDAHRPWRHSRALSDRRQSR
jgi:hypothetical protein